MLPILAESALVIENKLVLLCQPSENKRKAYNSQSVKLLEWK